MLETYRVRSKGCIQMINEQNGTNPIPNKLFVYENEIVNKKIELF